MEDAIIIPDRWTNISAYHIDEVPRISESES